MDSPVYDSGRDDGPDYTISEESRTEYSVKELQSVMEQLRGSKDGGIDRSMMRRSMRLDKDDISKNFKVVVRVRPPLPRELEGDRFVNCIKTESERTIAISENFAEEAGPGYEGAYATHAFTFDQVYGVGANQKEVYETTAREAVVSTLQGYNATIIAYGQTGTGKTYTMEGFTNTQQRGIIPRSIEEIFNYIQNSVNPRTKFLVRASFLQIYNEVISDLLKPERTNLVIREDKKKGVFVEGLSEWVVRSPQEIYGLMQRGAAVRATGSTKMNEVSSRSHAVFVVIVEQSETKDLEEVTEASGADPDIPVEVKVRQSFKIGKLNLVDLAGSERVRLTGATGRRLEESKKINQSLSALGNVIAALTDPSRAHVPYRDSKLTRILEDSLGGNCKTTMMAMISPALEAFNENLSTLKFANRAKNIKNDPRINEDLDQKALLRKYERELKVLRQELEERSKTVFDKRRLLELEEQKRRAEEDKLAALLALEKRSKEFMNEKEEKRRLEERIVAMQSQLLIGGHNNLADTPAFRTALQQEQYRIRKEYESRLAELENERQSIEEDKAQVDRYKQLLLKQRDIMIALTARLNERDESILALQEELDAYDRHQRMMEDILDQKTAALIHWQRLAMEGNADVKQLVQEQGEAGFDPDAILPLPSGKGLSFASERRYAPYGDSVVVDENAPSNVQSLSADEKVHELVGLLDSRQKDQETLARELEEVRAEKVSLEYLLREKLEKMVQTEIEERLNVYRRELEQWKTNHNLAEERRRLSEYMLELGKKGSDSPQFYDRVKQVVEREIELAQKPFQETVSKLKGDVQQKDNEKRQLQEEINQLRTEVARMKVRGSDGGVDIDQLWQRVEMAETEAKLLREKARSEPTVRHGSNAADNEVAEATDSTASSRIRQLEGRVESLKSQHGQFRNDVLASMELKAQEIQHLEEANQRLLKENKVLKSAGSVVSDSGEEERLAREVDSLRGQAETNSKERAALKTIMESKIKGLVDNVVRVLADANGDPSALAASNTRMHRELSALQKLVNASIVALKNSDRQATLQTSGDARLQRNDSSPIGLRSQADGLAHSSSHASLHSQQSSAPSSAVLPMPSVSSPAPSQGSPSVTSFSGYSGFTSRFATQPASGNTGPSYASQHLSSYLSPYRAGSTPSASNPPPSTSQIPSSIPSSLRSVSSSAASRSVSSIDSLIQQKRLELAQAHQSRS